MRKILLLSIITTLALSEDKALDISNEQDLEREKIQLEREKVQLERDKLQFEKEKLKVDNSSKSNTQSNKPQSTSREEIPSSGFFLGGSIGSTSTTTSVTASISNYSASGTSTESGGTLELVGGIRLYDNYQFGLTFGSIAVAESSDNANETNSISYSLASLDYIATQFHKKFKPFIGVAVGQTSMEYYLPYDIHIEESTSTSGYRFGFLYDFSSWSLGWKYQSLSVDLKGSDTGKTSSGTDITATISHKDFASSMFLFNYHF